MILGELVVVDAVDHREIGAVGRGGNEHALGPGLEVSRGLLFGRKDAGALERDIDAEFLPRQLGRVLHRRDLDLAVAAADRIALDLYLAREAAVNGIKAQQMGVGLDRSEIVHRHDLDIVASRLDDGTQHVAADPAEPVDGDPNRHVPLLVFASL